MSKRTPSLRSTLAAVTVLITGLAVLVCVALVFLTTLLHRATVSIGASVESVRLAEKAEIALLLHGRAHDTLVQREIEGDLRRILSEARRFVTTEHEAHVLREAVSHVDIYLENSRNPELVPAELAASQGSAYDALHALITDNVAQSRTDQERAARWDRRADVLGIGVGALVILVSGGLLVWLKARALQPVFRLAAAMERFGRGDLHARAEELGPAELVEMSRRFNEMAAALAAQRHAQMAFLGGVAHDLRSPLGALKMSVAVVHLQSALPPEPRLRQLGEVMNRQITRLERMIGDFLDMARIEAGELELRLQPQDARALIGEVLGLFDGEPAQPRFDVSLPGEAVPIQCDPLRVEQVIANLISNAMKYSPAGSRVEVALEVRGAEAMIRVTDFGTGISQEDQRRLFEPFRRLGLAKDSVPGVGLGLFTVRRIVVAHGGRIEVDSAPGAGSTFQVYLPLRRGPDAPRPTTVA